MQYFVVRAYSAIKMILMCPFLLWEFHFSTIKSRLLVTRLLGILVNGFSFIWDVSHFNGEIWLLKSPRSFIVLSIFCPVNYASHPFVVWTEADCWYRTPIDNPRKNPFIFNYEFSPHSHPQAIYLFAFPSLSYTGCLEFACIFHHRFCLLVFTLFRWMSTCRQVDIC